MKFPRMVQCGACVHSSDPRNDKKIRCGLGRYHYPEYEPWWPPDEYHPCGKYSRGWDKHPLKPPLFYNGLS